MNIDFEYAHEFRPVNKVLIELTPEEAKDLRSLVGSLSPQNIEKVTGSTDSLFVDNIYRMAAYIYDILVHEPGL